MPEIFDATVRIVGRPFPIYNLFVIFVGIAASVLLWLLLDKTSWGETVRASASDREMASALGVNIPRLFTVVFSFAAMLAALSGALGTPVRAMTPGIGTSVIIDVFIVTVIGGLGNLLGAFVGALVIGLMKAYGVLLFPRRGFVHDLSHHGSRPALQAERAAGRTIGDEELDGTDEGRAAKFSSPRPLAPLSLSRCF